MIAFRRLSTCPTLPDLMRADAEVRAARWKRTTPIEIWCRPATLLLLPRHDCLPAAVSGPALQSLASTADRVRDDCREFVMCACLDAASFVLCVGRLLLRVGLIGPGHATLALRWSCWLTQRGMLFRRSQRPRRRC